MSPEPSKFTQARRPYSLSLDAQAEFNRTLERWNREPNTSKQIKLAGKAAELLWAADAAAIILYRGTGGSVPNLIHESRMANSLRHDGHGVPPCIQRQAAATN